MAARGTTTRPIRVLVFGLPKMLHAIVLRALNGLSDIDVLDGGGSKELAAVAKLSRPDVIVTSAQQSGEAARLPENLFDSNPRVRVFCIAADGRNAWRRELRLSTIGLGDISPEELASMIRESARQPMAAS